MKKGKHVEKPVGPMFPRLHVNDTEKGGPRAPPRNKMALYEQFSIPSQRQQQQPTSAIPPPRNPNKSTDLGLQASSSRGTGGHEKSSSVYTEFSMSSTPKPEPKPNPKKDEDDFAVPVFVHSMKLQDPRRKHVCYDSRFKVDAVNKENPNPNPRVGVLNTEKRVQTSDLNLNESRVYSNMVNSKCTNASDEFISCMDTGYTSQPRVDLSLKEQGHVDEISENTIVDSITVSELSPDDVVTMLGQKCFWRARKQLLNQQRLFANQIFDLHRLITVQKLLAGSPQILLQGDKTSSKKLTLDLAIKPSTTQTTKPKEAIVEPLENIEHSMVGKTNPSTSLNHHHPIQPPPNNNTQILGTAPETIPGMHPWPYYQTAEHFFVPEMSPSEGFIFKAYPITDFMGPVPHNNNNNIPPHPIGYFPQFGISTNQTLIGQTQPTNPFCPPNGAHISMTSRGSELLQQVSTASSPSVQASDGRNGNTLPLFPTVSTTTKVIKVVPHNATTASESVARIFQSIQEGRK